MIATTEPHKIAPENGQSTQLNASVTIIVSSRNVLSSSVCTITRTFLSIDNLVYSLLLTLACSFTFQFSRVGCQAMSNLCLYCSNYPQMAAMTAVKRLRTWLATVCSCGLSIACMEATGSTALTSTPSFTSRRITLQGNMAPTRGSIAMA